MFHAFAERVLKTPGMKIPGVFLCLLFVCPSFADCGRPSGALVDVARVSDGDTLKLADGRFVRVLSINAPEVAHGSKPGQPLGREARAAAEAFIRRGGGKVRLGFEHERTDRYGRLLAHIYDSQGRSLAAHLLNTGMGLQISVPPNGAQESCLLRFERKAERQRLGVWANHYWNVYPVRDLSLSDTGFRQVRGRVTSVVINKSVWLEFDGNLVVRIGKQDWSRFAYRHQDWLALKGRQLDIRGWIKARKISAGGKSRGFKPLLLELRSPGALRVNDA